MEYKSSLQHGFCRFHFFLSARKPVDLRHLVPEHTQPQEFSNIQDQGAHQPPPRSPRFIMDFEFRSDNEKLAVAGDDVDIYPRLGITNTARWNRNEKYGPDLVMTEPKNIEITGYHYSGQPGMLPLALNDLQQFVNSLNSLAGYWSVLWFSGIHHNADHLNADGFRCVVAWGSVDLTIRPVPGVDGPSRLS